MGTLIQNGTVISPAGRIAQDVLVEGERVVALYIPGTAPTDGHRVIDATGKYVIPGGTRLTELVEEDGDEADEEHGVV